jgi:hypothetical protein
VTGMEARLHATSKLSTKLPGGRLTQGARFDTACPIRRARGLHGSTDRTSDGRLTTDGQTTFEGSSGLTGKCAAHLDLFPLSVEGRPPQLRHSSSREPSLYWSIITSLSAESGQIEEHVCRRVLTGTGTNQPRGNSDRPPRVGPIHGRPPACRLGS